MTKKLDRLERDHAYTREQIRLEKERRELAGPVERLAEELHDLHCHVDCLWGSGQQLPSERESYMLMAENLLSVCDRYNISYRDAIDLIQDLAHAALKPSTARGER